MADLTPEQRMNVEEWIGALRSGEYPQTQGALRDRNGYCCLGVAAATQRVPQSEVVNPTGRFEFDFPTEEPSVKDNMIPHDWAIRTFGVWLLDAVSSGGERRSLWQLNDQDGASFDDIADEIKKRAYGS